MDKIVKLNKDIYFLFIAYLLSILIACLVYMTGGTRYVYVMFMNIPIIIATSTNKKVNAFVHAIISGLLVGPFMPLDVELQKMQELHNWGLRLGFFLILSIIISVFSDYHKKDFEKILRYEKEVSESHISTIYALVKLSESRDDETGAHLERVSQLCRLLTEKLRELPNYRTYITDDYIENIFKASTLHDIGKVGIPDHILLKPGQLTKDEFDIIKKHTTIGASILSEIQKKYPNNKFLEIGINIVHYHHERWDGTGYPVGLIKERIPLSARIMAIVDVYDALRTKRVYKDAYTHLDSIDIIKNNSGTQFDPNIVGVLVTYESDFERIFDETMNNIR